MIKDKLVFSLKNPVIAGHQVQGQAILPGLAYIDILLQCFRKHGYPFDELTVQNITIHHPLIVDPQGNVTLTIEAVETEAGHWQVALKGDLLYITAQVNRTGKQLLTGTIAIAPIKSQSKKQYPIGAIYDQYQARGLDHSGLMKAAGTVYETSEGMLFDGWVGSAAEAIAGYFLFHPALIDASAVATRGLFDQLVGKEETLFLPLFYGAFQGTACIQQRCYAWVPVNTISRKGELITLTIHYYDQAGQK
ncbi:polyketide synthase dehydratase domain-containing protein [Paraflavitalea speifideaquila]|uniref:polyketide synthase dehydratase domain-containing protein n=1 Tax=Paraflavitalea speifideaquila TaxID=3076558 RepID=UPI0028E77FB3|nr:polyketide synthase dehydratase domain-containing protein [Paraflavitalea speifideiaquila]